MRFAKNRFIILGVVFTAVASLLIGPPIRRSIDVNMRVVDANDRPIVGAELYSHERHRHRLIPIPFFGPTWWSETRSRVAITDADGRITVSYRRDFLELDRIVINGVQAESFASELALQDGSSNVTLNRLSERYGIQANSPKPYEQNYVIRIR